MLVSFCMKIMSVVITVILYGRMIQIYLYCSVSPVPFATMTNRDEVCYKRVKTTIAPIKWRPTHS